MHTLLAYNHIKYNNAIIPNITPAISQRYQSHSAMDSDVIDTGSRAEQCSSEERSGLGVAVCRAPAYGWGFTPRLQCTQHPWNGLLGLT